MSEMVERVAKAIAAQMGASTCGFRWEEARGQYESLARAAIEAMREPTPWVRECGQIHVPDNVFDADRAETIWKAMIDAALT